MATNHVVHHAMGQHWVGDGFPVRSVFSYDRHGSQISPFLLLDFASAYRFPPSQRARGVGAHPHRGFETVTLVYQGELAHRDSNGNGGTIGPGDVQWMTAGSGILHDEYHSEAFLKSGGLLEMAQLWVNLPSQHKLTPPAYQAILKSEIPQIDLADGAGTMRIIAGHGRGRQGPAHTFTAMNVWDLSLHPGAVVELAVQAGWNNALVVLRGLVEIDGATIVRETQWVQLERGIKSFSVEANNDALLLWLSGEPIEQPVVGYGPFVMNTQQEIDTALTDYRLGEFGEIT